MGFLIEHRARAVAGVLAADGLAHLYWATGATWPFAGARELSLALLGGETSFAPPNLIGLATLLFGAAAAVLLRVRAERRRWLWQAVTLAITAGLTCRTVMGLVWMFGVGVPHDGPFYWLNLFVYTPLCAVLAVLCWTIARHGVQGRAWARRAAVAGPAVLVAVLLGTAYAYVPPEEPRRVPSKDSRYVDTPVAQFHYLQKGSGTPVVLLSPGAGPAFAWHRQLEVLSERHTVYVVDMPGQGDTRIRKAGFRFDLDAMTGAIGSFLDAMGLRTVALAGNSWSGGWGLAYAQRHPERVGRLLLFAPSGLAERDPLTWELLKLPVLGETLVKLSASRGAAASSLRSLFEHKDRLTDEVIDQMWVPSTFRDNMRATYELERGLDWRVTQAALPSTRQPTLVIWGRQDSVLPVGQASRFGDLMPAATVRVLEDCGHALTLDCPDQVTTLMGDFLGDR